MVSGDEDTQPTVRDKYKPINRTCIRHTPSFQPSEISDDKEKAEIPEKPRGMGQGLSPLQLFTGAQVQYNLNHFHPFGWPNYFINESPLYSQRIYHKWKTRSKVRVYLGQYPLHNHESALVLNPDSVLVSPQFHVRYDLLFTTTKDFD